MTFLNSRRFLLITGTCILLITALSITTILLSNSSKTKDTTTTTSVDSEIKAPLVVNVPEPEITEYKFDASKYIAFPKKSSRTLTSAEEEELKTTGEGDAAIDPPTSESLNPATTEMVNEHLTASESDKEDKVDGEQHSDADTPPKEIHVEEPVQQQSAIVAQEEHEDNSDTDVDTLGVGLAVDMTSASESDIEKEEKETKVVEHVEPASSCTLKVSEINKERMSYGYGRHSRTFGEILVSGLPGNRAKKVLFSAVKDEPINLFIAALKLKMFLFIKLLLIKLNHTVVSKKQKKV